MRIILILGSLFISLFAGATEKSPILILNMANKEILPHHFRTSQSPFGCLICINPSKEGLLNLNISGSGQFSELSWAAIVKAIKHSGPIYDVDLRQEVHGFLNGAAISLYSTQNWGNLGESDPQVQVDELTWLNRLKKQKEVAVGLVESKDDKNILETKPLIEKVESVLSEHEMISKAKANYFRLYVSDHRAPLPSEVDKFIQFVQTLPKNAWLHFHCKAGDGRTTTFMTLYDIMRNAKRVSFHDIVARQNQIGGQDLFRTYDPSNWKYPYAKDRAELLSTFYLYAKNNNDDFKTLWREHLNNLKKRNTSIL
jgi:hypothetical protein